MALYSGNIEFARSEVNYFSSGQNPLLHTWSLAVEVQFVWPLLILLGALVLRDGLRRRSRTTALADGGCSSAHVLRRPNCLLRQAAGLLFARSCDYDSASLSSVGVAAQNAAALGVPITFVDMNDQICSTVRCMTVRQGIVVYADDTQLTATCSRALASVLGARLAFRPKLP